MKTMNKVKFEIALAERGIHTTTALSNITGISRQTLTPIRLGSRDATVEIAEQISKALKFTPDEYTNIFTWQSMVTAARDAAGGV